MEPPRIPNDSLTPSQRQAVEARGNILVMAGAGTGKTKTLVARCLDCLDRDRSSLDELLIVTFTEAAAAELRQRLRRAIEEKVAAESTNSQLPDAAKRSEDGSTLNFWQEQLARFDIAHIGTLHSFCLRLVREHFYELGLDPQLAILDEGEARQHAGETLDERFQTHYAGVDQFSLAVQNLIQVHGGGRDENIRKLVLRLHHYAQTRPDAAGWLAEQIQNFSSAEPAEWQRWLMAAIKDWRDEWLPVLQNLGTPISGSASSSLRPNLAGPEAGAPSSNVKAAELVDILSRLEKNCTREQASEVLEQIISADGNWPAKKKTMLRKPLEDLFDEAAFLAALAVVKDGGDPLAEDWAWVRGHMETLLRLAQEFAQEFARRKLADGVLDFHDLEQFSLKLLWDFQTNQPTTVAELWRRKLRFVFVDEYQDINAAQDKIIAALARDIFSPSPLQGERAGVRGSEFANNRPPLPDPFLLRGGEGENACIESGGNRFLVGDVKQSIYRFRLADPKIFRDYARDWHGANGQVIPLSENFRSRESLLDFVNSVFAPLMCAELGGVEYNDDAKLKFGSPETRTDFSSMNDSAPRTELLLRFKSGRGELSEADEDSGAEELADLDETQKEARLLVMRLNQLRAEKNKIWDDKEEKFRAIEWRDMAVLLRAMSGKSEIYAMEFERAGVPLVIARGGFYDSSEIADLLSLLQLLDNPLQDVPCIAVLRSPLVGLSLDELAQIRLVTSGHFWFALNQAHSSKSTVADEVRGRIGKFLEQFTRWRKLARQVSLSRCLEAVLTETHYAGWLRSRPRGAQRHANVVRFLNLAERFDQFQRQGLYRFLQFIAAQRDAEAEPDVAAGPAENAVSLMSIHQSKGLEFPVVALADLAKPFNTQDLRGEIIFDETFGLCPRVKPPQTGRRYSSLPHWLAQRHQRREQAGEELRLLYVALTRARDRLILTGSVTEKKWTEQWQENAGITVQEIVSARSYADWLGLWFARQPGASSERQGRLSHLCWRIVEDTELTNRENSGLSIPNPEIELPALNDETVRRLRDVLDWKYPHLPATERTAKSSVTALRREAEELDDEAEQIFPVRQGIRSRLSAADTGTAHHKFLQYFSLADVGLAALESEAARLEREKVLSVDERAALDLNAVAAFWTSEAGQKIRQHPADVKRELPFTARFSPAELGEITGRKPNDSLADEFIVVQGVADLVVLLPKEIWLVDFKTDAVRADDLPEKTRFYTPQLKLYASALGRIYSRPVTDCWLYFLSAWRTIKV